MKLLVIGGTGFLGPAIVRRALEADHEVLVYHRGQHHSDRDPEVPHVHGGTAEIGEHLSAIRRFSPEAVIDGSQKRADTTASVINAIRGLSGRYVLVSSGDVYRAFGVYHRTEGGPLQEMPVNEDAALRTRPSIHHSETEDKILAERAALDQQIIPVTVVRAPAIFGPGDYQRRIAQRAEMLQQSGGHLVLSEGRAAWRFCYGYVDDIADSILLCAQDRRQGNFVFNAGYHDGISTMELYRLVASAIRWDGEISVEEKVESDDKRYEQHLYLNTSRIRDQLGYTERLPIDEAVRLTVRAT